jgi:hypothetical protein
MNIRINKTIIIGLGKSSNTIGVTNNETFNKMPMRYKLHIIDNPYLALAVLLS